MKNLQIQQVLIKDLISPDYNPRIRPEKTIEQLKKSIKRDGFVNPIILNSAPKRKNIIIAGNFRAEVAKQLGITSVPAIYINVPNLEKEKRLNLSLNRISGDWNYELLKNFDIGMLLESGFDDLDLTHIFDDALSVEEDNFDVDKAVSEIKTPKTKPGDIIILGDHRLVCGDSTDPTVVSKLIGSHKINMLNFDPPYNIGLDYNNGISTKGKYGNKKD